MSFTLFVIFLLSFHFSANFSDAKWVNRVLIPKTVRYSSEKHNSHSNHSESTEHSSASLPHADVLVETYQAGESMISYINSVSAAASTGTDGAADAKQIALNKEIAAIGLDSILKMVRILVFLCLCCVRWMKAEFRLFNFPILVV